MQDLRLLLLNESEAVVEEDEVCEDTVEVCVQVEKHHLAKVAVVEMGQHVEQQPLDLLHNGLKGHREVVLCKATNLGQPGQ